MLKPFCNVTDQAQCRFLGLPSPVPRFRRRYAVVPCSRPMNKPTAPVQVQAVVSDQGSPARLESGPCSLADRLRLGTLTEDGLSYKEKFIVRCYEVGINKTATVETIANLLQVLIIFKSIFFVICTCCITSYYYLIWFLFCTFFFQEIINLYSNCGSAFVWCELRVSMSLHVFFIWFIWDLW